MFKGNSFFSILAGAVFAGIFVATAYVLATYGVDEPYPIGNTLNPACAPNSSAYCTVTSAATFSFGANDFSGAGDFVTTGAIYNRASDSKHYFGAGNNASIYFDGSNLVINPAESGDGRISMGGVFTFPTVDGSNGQVLQTNGSGVVSWGTNFGAQNLTTTGSITGATGFFTSADGLTLGTNEPTPTPNIPGKLKFFGGGNTDTYITFTAPNTGTNSNYTLPTLLPQGNSQALIGSTAGVLSWGTDFGANNLTTTGTGTFTSIASNAIVNSFAEQNGIQLDINGITFQTGDTARGHWDATTGDLDLYGTDITTTGTGSFVSNKINFNTSGISISDPSGGFYLLVNNQYGSAYMGSSGYLFYGSYTGKSGVYMAESTRAFVSNAFQVDYNGVITGANIIDNGLTANLGVYTNGSKQLTSTPPTSGVLGYWSRTGTALTASNAGDTLSKIILTAGTATAGTAPLKFTSGTLLTTPEAGTIEYLSSKFYLRGTEGWAFGAATEYINSANAGYLDLNADGGIRLNAYTTFNSKLDGTRSINALSTSYNINNIKDYVTVTNAGGGGAGSILDLSLTLSGTPGYTDNVGVINASVDPTGYGYTGNVTWAGKFTYVGANTVYLGYEDASVNSHAIYATNSALTKYVDILGEGTYDGINTNGAINGLTVYQNGNAVIDAGNIGSQSVNYASTAGSATDSSAYHSYGSASFVDSINFGAQTYTTSSAVTSLSN